jgi:zinc transporter ZupT
MSTVVTAALHPEMPLRKRIRVLERASSLSSLADAKIIPEMKHHDSVEDIAPSSFTDYESQSDTSGSGSGDDKAGEENEHPEGLEEHEHEHSRHRRHDHHDSGPASRSRAWYEFDLAVVVALVSPVGNWLTGGDHIKNMLLIVLLILYLHQIIEGAIFTLFPTKRY